MSKKIIGILLLIILAGVGVYLDWKRNKIERYNFFVVERQNLVQEITATGMVEPAESINLAFEKTGVLSGLFIEEGQKVERGTLLAQLDVREAEKKLKDAQLNLENAKLALEKMKLEKTQLLRGDTLTKNYEEGLAFLAHFYNESTSMLDSLDDILFGEDLDENEKNIDYYASYDEKFSGAPQTIRKLYQEAEELHQQSLVDYHLAERGSGEIREKAIRSTYDLVIKLAEIVKSTRDVIRNLQDLFIEEGSTHKKESTINSHANTLDQHASTLDNYVENLVVIINAINDYYDDLEALSLNIKTQELLVKQRENELAEAETNLAKHFLYSPMSGVVSRVDLKVSEVVTANIAVIELISESDFEIVADIYEEDIVKIKFGTPVEINLPAFPKKTFQGKVTFIKKAEKIIDGVVYYETKIAFDEIPAEEIKPSMTADITISFQAKENILVVPREAIKEADDKTIVEVLVDNLIQEREVKIGLRGEEVVEIVSGLTEGEKVILP